MTPILLTITLLCLLGVESTLMENSVLKLDDDTIEEQLDNQECQNVESEFAQAALALKFPADTDDYDTIQFPVQLAKIDCDENPRAALNYNIQSFPKLILFKSGVLFQYSGNLTTASIIQWVHLRRGPHIHSFASCSEIIKLFEGNLLGPEDSLVIYFPSKTIPKFDQETQRNLYYQTVSIIEEIFDKILFTESEDTECGLEIPNKKKIKVQVNKPLVIMMKKFDPTNVEIFMGNVGVMELADWFVIQSIPPLVKFDAKYMQHVIGVNSPSVVLFAQNKGLENQEYFQVFQEASEIYKGKHIFVHVDLNDSNAQVQKLVELIGIQTQPSLMIVEPTEDQTLKKYQYEPKYLEIITLDKFHQFMSNYQNGLLIQFWRNQVISDPHPENSPLEQINGNHFRQIILAKIDRIVGKEYLINFYVEWCHHCASMNSMLEQYFTKYKIPNLFVGTIDMSKNELGMDFEIKGYPTLFFWSEKSKFDSPIEFKYQRTIENLDEFLKNHSNTYALYLEQQSSKTPLHNQPNPTIEESQASEEATTHQEIPGSDL